MLVKCTRFYPYFDLFGQENKGIGNKSQSRDKILYILATSICILPSYDGS